MALPLRQVPTYDPRELKASMDRLLEREEHTTENIQKQLEKLIQLPIGTDVKTRTLHFRITRNELIELTFNTEVFHLSTDNTALAKNYSVEVSQI